jgi:hypothetical protein
MKGEFRSFEAQSKQSFLRRLGVMKDAFIVTDISQARSLIGRRIPPPSPIACMQMGSTFIEK